MHLILLHKPALLLDYLFPFPILNEIPNAVQSN